MASVQESVDVDVPIRVAYDQWTQFESFPQFMGGVEKITQIDDTHTHWVTNIDGVKREFDAEITEQHVEERVAWTSTNGEAKHAGVVTFHRLDDAKTRVMIQIDWEPEGLVEGAAGPGGLAPLPPAGGHAVHGRASSVVVACTASAISRATGTIFRRNVSRLPGAPMFPHTRG